MLLGLAYAPLAHTVRIGALLHTRTRDVPRNVSTSVLGAGYRRTADTPRVLAYAPLAHTACVRVSLHKKIGSV